MHTFEEDMGHSICSVDGFNGAHMDLIIHLYTSVAGGYIYRQETYTE